MRKEKGIITTLALVFGSIFLLLFSGILSFTLIQLKQSRQKVAWNQSLVIAEAGLNYYRWHLAHDPGDLQDSEDWCCETPPCSACGPYEHTYLDPEGGELGSFVLEIQGSQQCGQVTAVTITSTGQTNEYPDVERTVKAKFVKPTVADFTYLLNDNVWAGADRDIRGPYHSNGGIRMDGSNRSIVSSARDEWVCTDSFGCQPCPSECRRQGTTCICPGVFTSANGNEDLFDFPVPSFDFDGITMDLAQIKNMTQNGQGIYFPPSGDDGYHAVFKEDHSIDMYLITRLDSVYAYDEETGWHWEDSEIDNESFLGNYQIPADCGLVFIEDDLWAEGTINGKVTTVSADLISPTEQTDIWLSGNIKYTTRDGSDGLALVAQKNSLIGLSVPESMILNGVFIAQNGHFGRNHYPCSWYWNDCKKDTLEIFGSIVSNGRVGTKWSSGGSWSSGFNERTNTYDPTQSFSPTSFLPAISDQSEFREWEEVE